MNLLSIGYSHLHDYSFVVDRPNGIDSWLFLLIKTPAIFLDNGVKKKVNENSFVLYDTDTPQYYKAYEKEYIDDWFHFLPSEEDILFFHSLHIPLNKVTYLGNISELSTIVRNMTYEFYADNPYKKQIIRNYFHLLFYKTNQLVVSDSIQPNRLVSSHFMRMQALRNDIYNNPQAPRNVDSMASQLSMSRSAFQHNYKKIFGKSVLCDIINSRINRVKFYLRTSDMTLCQISQLCGYHNELHLIRQFKQHTGVTPTEFRNHN